MGKNRLQDLLEILGISASELSKETGIPKSSISMWLNGNRIMRQDKIGAICERYSIDPSWLMGYDVPMERKMSMLSKYSSAIESIGKNAESILMTDFSKKEWQIIEAYRKASDKDKRTVDAVLELDIENKEEPKLG